jgi:D-alanyl-D-alanine carboxypeptidase
VLGVLAAFTVAGISWDCAEARTSRPSKQNASKQNAKSSNAKSSKNAKRRVVHGPNYNPPYAAIVVDANSDRVLHEASPDLPRHPASLTKIMTLYLLFEQIEAGKFKLDTPLQVSAHAAAQTPTKLGLKANQTIRVEDAIKGLVTKSANDAAAVVGESIGGTESDFARLMTEKARALGMANTTYINASGLPAAEQITTARDQAILGRAVQDRFPVFYRYFSTPSFRYGKVEMRNHNALLGNVKGLDGIKTGYTEASGYNLVTSVRRDDRHIVAVVLGGKSNAKRDARMRELIEEHIKQAAARRTAPKVMEAARPDNAQGNAPEDKLRPAIPVITPATIPVPSPRMVPGASTEPTPASASTEPTPASASTGPAPASASTGPAPASASTESTPASARSDQPPAANPQAQEAKPQTVAPGPKAQAARTTATARLPTAGSRQRESKAAAARARGASSVSIVAPSPIGSW